MKNAEPEIGQLHDDWSHGSPWKGRGKLSDLVAELDRQKASKIDFVADQRDLSVFGTTDGKILLDAKTAQVGEWLTKVTPFTPHALRQFGQRISPPVDGKFMLAASEERSAAWASYLSHCMENTSKRQLWRLLDGNVRAVLSDQFRIIDNFDVAFSALNAVRDNGGEVIECTLSETGLMRLKFTTRDVFDTLEATKNDGNAGAGGLGNQEHLSRVSARHSHDMPGGPNTVHPLVTIGNSETGGGCYYTRSGILQSCCYNLATVETVVQKVHLGSKLESGIFSAETVETENKAIMLKARDAINAAFDVRTFKKIVDKVRGSTSNEIEAPTSAVDNVVKNTDISPDQRDSLLQYFVKDYNQTQYGLAQAVGRLAQDQDDPEKANDMEDIAGKLMTSDALAKA